MTSNPLQVISHYGTHGEQLHTVEQLLEHLHFNRRSLKMLCNLWGKKVDVIVC